MKKFINEDVPLFHNVEFKAKPGANPDLLMLNAEGLIVERIDLSPFTQVECNELLQKKGFYKKNYKDEEVPEQYAEGPYSEQREEL